MTAQVQQLTTGEANVEVRLNEIHESVFAAAVFSKNHETTSGLTWGYYGCDDFNGNTIANGTVTLTDASTNYVVVLRSTGVVSVSTTTTNATDPLYARLYKVTTSGGAVTAVVDERWKANGLMFNSSGSTGTVTSVDASGGVETVSGSAITSTGTIRAAHAVNAQTGTTYTYVTGDRGKLVTHSNAGAIAGTLPQAGTTGFETKWFMWVQNRGAGTLTITPTTSTIDGAASLALTTGQGVLIVSDGTNYYTMRGVSGSGGDASTNTSTSVDSEIALFSGTGGKTLKRATTTGLLKGTSGVLSAATAGTDYYNPGGTDVALADGGTGASTAAGARANLQVGQVVLAVACSDESTALTTGTAKVKFINPYATAFNVTAVVASLSTAQTSGSIFTVDINEAGTTILSTKITIDNTETNSSTAAAAAVISDSSIAAYAEISVDIDQVGDGTAKGLKVYVIGYPS